MERKRLIRSTWIMRGVVGLLFLGGLWMLYGRPLKPHWIKPGSIQPDAVQLGSLQLFGYGESGNRKTLQWTLTAIDVTVAPDGRTYQSKSIRDGLFYKAGVVTARFMSGPATCSRDSKNQDLNLTGPIQVDGVNGAHLRCGTLRYTSNTHRLTAEGPIQVTTDKTHFAAGHLDADIALERLHCDATPGQPVSLISRLDPLGRS